MVYKLVSAVMQDRLRVMIEKHHVLEASQEGFRGGRGTDRQGQSVTWMYDRARKGKRKIYAAYVDFSLAFDLVDHEALFMAMEKFGVPDVDLFRMMYRAAPYVVSNAFGDTAKINVGRGTRQGDVLSPLIFDLFVNVLLRYLDSSGTGTTECAGKRVTHRAFADDIDMVSDTAQGLQEMLNRLERFCKWSGMEVNVKKTKVCSYDYGKGKEAADVRELTYNGQLLAEVYDNAFPVPGVLDDVDRGLEGGDGEDNGEDEEVEGGIDGAQVYTFTGCVSVQLFSAPCVQVLLCSDAMVETQA
jgi:hypothetical protein